MNRRGILGMLGMGTVAGPAIAQNALNQAGISSIGHLAASETMFADFGDDVDKSYNKEPNSYGVTRVKNSFRTLEKAKDNYNNIDDITHQMRNVSSFDADLFCNKSMSLTTKVRLQAIRNARLAKKREIERCERNLSSNLRALKGSLKDGDFYGTLVAGFGVGTTVPTLAGIQDILKRNEDEDEY